MKTLLFILLACFFSCRQGKKIVDGIEYETVYVSDTLVQPESEDSLIIYKIDYPCGKDQESSNIREELVDDILFWTVNYAPFYESCERNIPIETLPDSLKSWIHNKYKNPNTNVMTIEVLPSGIEGISSFRRTNALDPISDDYSVDAKKGGTLFFNAISDEQRVDSLILKTARRQKDDIVAHGIKYDEDKIVNDIRHIIRFFSLCIVNKEFLFFYDVGKDDKAYYITIPFHEIEECGLKYHNAFPEFWGKK